MTKERSVCSGEKWLQRRGGVVVEVVAVTSDYVFMKRPSERLGFRRSRTTISAFLTRFDKVADSATGGEK